ncbi:BRCA1-associated 2 [Penicillium riverlandense]|uniref:BRCA1-associated 2 n=1 Tax=Penicillium riverlandense TaxID=1903569 RepID=UPI002548FDD4|nr:BRCA1-associated 2 [Penicillium riverlandense]KAJ5832987.1 BRCA1-associated 2 [Penicillium riverlandense]
MPAYFFNLKLELLLRSTETSSDQLTATLALDNAWEALLPFQKRSTAAATTRPVTSSRTSSGTGNESQSSNPPSETTLAQRPKSTPLVNLSTPSSSLAEYTANLNTYTSGSVTPGTPYPDSQVESSTYSIDIENDKRFGAISISCIDMVAPQEGSARRASKHGNAPPFAMEDNLVAAGIGTDILGGQRTKGRYIPLDQKIADSVWGIVHLYREAQETPYLTGNEDDYPTYLKGSAAVARQPGDQQQQQSAVGASSKQPQMGGSAGSLTAYPFPATYSSSAQNPEEECTTLCILAVPSYMSSSDFLGFVGEKTLDDVAHFRMIKTARANRYMVLMKFRNAHKAMTWQKEWNGKVFNSMEPETCHVVFVKAVEIQVVEEETSSVLTPAESSTLSPSHNPATLGRAPMSSAGQAALSIKPLAPPTPALIELPTCPVCLERMDETTGLLTIICQHVFHCTCLQKWKGSGCPVCRYTQDELHKKPQSLESPAECSVCHSELNLWACLICGNVGCGRYDGAHAFDHWKETMHAYAMDLDSHRVWDYVSDLYVHRILQSKTDGKLVELPAADNHALDPPDWSDAVPRDKFENLSVEYTHLLTSQLESQRAYFEEIVERAADKASRAASESASAKDEWKELSARIAELEGQHKTLTTEKIPLLERDRARFEKRAEKFEQMARSMEKDWREEKTINQSLLERIDFLSAELSSIKEVNEELKEQNRDLTFFISGSQRLQGQGEDIQEATLSVPDPPTPGKKKKGKGKGKVN